MASALGRDPGEARVHEELNEFDSRALFAARVGNGERPERGKGDRWAHFRALRETVLAWQRNEIARPPRTWCAFRACVGVALGAMATSGAERILAVSSGGAIAQIVGATIEAPPARAVELQLQTKNCAVTRLIAGRRGYYLNTFNEMPHIRAMGDARLVSYS